MSYAKKGHAHRDEKNDYSRLDKNSDIKLEIDQSESEDDEEETNSPDTDYISNAAAILVSEHSRGVKDAGI